MMDDPIVIPIELHVSTLVDDDSDDKIQQRFEVHAHRMNIMSKQIRAIHERIDDLESESEPEPEPDEETASGPADEPTDSLTAITGVGQSKADALTEAGFETLSDIRRASQRQLMEVDGIGPSHAARIKANVGTVDDPIEITEVEQSGKGNPNPKQPDPDKRAKSFETQYEILSLLNDADRKLVSKDFREELGRSVSWSLLTLFTHGYVKRYVDQSASRRIGVEYMYEISEDGRKRLRELESML